MTVFGVGELSAINAIAGSFAEKVPVIHIVGTPTTTAQDEGKIIHHSLGEGNCRIVANMYQNFTIAQANLRDAIKSPTLIDLTLQKCVEKSLPVYIELPLDMVHVPVSAAGLGKPILNSLLADEDQELEALVVKLELEDFVVNSILQRLYECRQPVVVVDGFTERFGVADEVNQFLKTSRLLAFATPFGQGIIDTSYPHYHGVYNGPAGSKTLETWFKECDLVIHIAPLKSDTNTYGFNTLASPTTTIELDSQYISIFGAEYGGLKLKSLFKRLLHLLDPSRLPPSALPEAVDFPQRCNPTLVAQLSGPIDQSHFWPTISYMFKSSDIVLVDAGTAWSGSEYFTLPSKTTLIKSGIWMSIGSMLGAGVGAAQAQHEMVQEGTRPEGRTIIFEGDGSFQMTAQAISDAIRNRLELILFVINNDGYTIERVIHGPHAYYNCIQSWSYTEAAKFFGAPECDPEYPVLSQKVTTWEELKEIIQGPQLQSGKGLNLVEVVMDRQDAPKSLTAFIDLQRPSKRA
ncbi:hypothetical protein N7476_000439 [Penicillium atrosanguineum]|uniref:Pyruvate decarboxylase n=1 Tax=Penicillium atrosanguineum TaxID=1132637 RepID=A0A9W9QBI6_9EURO|nr:hypothetical protein N7476_000439 [Penicillium atrosanguineum]